MTELVAALPQWLPWFARHHLNVRPDAGNALDAGRPCLSRQRTTVRWLARAP
jgi:hypothetical protein